MVDSKIIKSMELPIYADNKILGVDNKNPHEYIRGVTLRLVVVPIIEVVEISEHPNCLGVGNLGVPIGIVPFRVRV